MPYVFQETQVGEGRPASEFPSLPSEVYEETFAQAFEENPIAAMSRAKDLADDYRSGGKRLDLATATQRLKERGMEGDIKVSEAGITEAALNTLIERKAIERRRQEVFGQAEGGIGQGAAQLGIALGTSLVDPLNVATAFIPVISQARYTSMLAKAGSTAGRVGVRAGVGAIEGVAGAALIEPIIAGSRRYEQADYDMADSLLNVAFGGLFGAGLHSVGGAVSAGVRHYRGIDPEWKGLEGISPAEIPLVQNLRQEIARGMDVRDVARVTETWSPAARRAVEPDVRSVTPAEAAHQALPPQVRENALKQAIIQAVSDEPVNVQPMILAVLSRPSQSPAILRAQESNTFSANGQRGSLEGFPQPRGTPTERLFSNFADTSADKSPAAIARLRQKMLERANQDPRSFQKDDVLTHTGSFGGGLTIRVDAAKSGQTRVQVLKNGETVAAARVLRGKVDSISVAESQKGNAIGSRLLRYLDDQRIANIDEVPDRSPGFVSIQKKVIAERNKPTATMPAPDDTAKVIAHANKVLARETDTGTPTADALKMATEEASLAQSDLKAVADRLGLDAEDAELRDVLEAAVNSERWAKAAELATICLTRGG